MRIILLFLVCVFAVSCETTDNQKTKRQGAAVGALLGAAAGAALSGGDRKKGALIGAAIGGLAGTAYGESVNRKKEAYASNEEYLNANIAMSKKAQADSKLMIAANQKEIDSLNSRLVTLNAQSVISASDKTELQGRRTKLASQNKASRSQVVTLNEEIEMQTMIAKNEKGVQNDNLLAALRRDKESLSTQIAKVETQQNTVTKMIQ